MTSRISAHFSLSEFNCHSGEPVPRDLAPNVEHLVLTVLEPLRGMWGPIAVISGWRSRAWNTRVGGADDSTHVTGMGADVRPLRPADLDEFVLLVEQQIAAKALPMLGGLGKYPGWVHLDIRKMADGHLRRWVGKGMGSEPAGAP